MALRPIVIAPDPVLKLVAKPVETVDAGIAQLMDDMLETMYAANGIGLAAPQIGVSKRVVVVDVHEPDEPRKPIKLANPEIVWVSDDDKEREEGCLSLPEHHAVVERPADIKVRYLDETGVEKIREADGLLSVCIQHEIDHLDGILFVDRISALKRNMILRKLLKMKKSRKNAAVA